MLRLSILFSLLFTAVSISLAGQIEGRVLEVFSEGLQLELTRGDDELSKGDTMIFKIGPGDHAINYNGRLIQGKAVYYASHWHLETIFPLDGSPYRAMKFINQQLHEINATKTRRKALRKGDYIPNFGMVNQNGEFMQIKQLRGRAFILNFIFTRCAVPEMCPASSMKMAELQDRVRANGWDGLDFVTITFDPAYDSPGILKEYMQAYGIDSGNFHLLTNSDHSVVEDLLYQFGILTREENDTITHTMTTFLIDTNGKIIYTKQGSHWSVKEFLRKAKKLMVVKYLR